MPAWDKIPKISKYKIPEVAQYLRDLITEIVLYLMAVRICGSTPPRISTGAGFCLVTHRSREGTKAEPGTAAHEAAATSVN